MIPALIAAFLIALGAGGVAVVSDDARPGDVFFGVDQAVEQLQLMLTGSEESRNEVRIRIADERLKEIDDLSDDSSDDSSGTDSPDDSDRRLRIETGLSLAASTLAQISLRLQNEETSRRLQEGADRLNTRRRDLPQAQADRIRDRIELRLEDGAGLGDENHVRVEVNDGQVRVEVRKGDDDSDDASDDSSSSSMLDDSGNHRGGVTEAEADVFTDVTTVTVEVNDQKTSFTTSATTRDAIMKEILNRILGVTREEIEAVLVLQIENRASRPEDVSNSNGGSDDNGNSSGSGNRGRGGN